MCIYIEYEFGYIYMCLCVFICLFVCVCVWVCVWKRTESVFFMIYGILTVRLKIHRVFYRDAFVHHAVFPFRVPMHLSSICNVYFPRPDHIVQLQQPYSLPIKWFSLSLSHPPFSLSIFRSLCTFMLISNWVFFRFAVSCFESPCSFSINFLYLFLYKFDKAMWTVSCKCKIESNWNIFFSMMLFIIVDAKYLPLF